MHRQRHARSIQNHPPTIGPLLKNGSNVAEQLILVNNAIKKGEEVSYNEYEVQVTSHRAKRPATIYSGELDTTEMMRGIRNIASQHVT